MTSQSDIANAHVAFYKKLYAKDSTDLRVQQDVLSKVEAKLSVDELCTSQYKPLHPPWLGHSGALAGNLK